MPKIQRSDIPEALLRHLLQRRRERGIATEDLVQFAHWLDGSPTVPVGPWYKRFQGFVVCGEGSLVKTFLTSQQTAVGTEVK
jgi:hypothetical protein